MVEGLKAIMYGVGEIGKLIVENGLKRGFEFVGGVDVDPEKVGRDLGLVVGVERLGVKIVKEPEEIFSRERVDVVFHATGSYLDRVYPQIVKCLKFGVNVVSTCETLSYPYYRYPELSQLIDAYAKAHDSTVVGAGVNPGFLLDILPAVLTAPLVEFERIKATRSLDASKRRLAFQKKIGVGMEPSEFKKMLEEGKLTGHVGYVESVLLVSKALNLNVEKVEEGQEPIIAREKVESRGVVVEEGKVVGVEGYGRGYVGGEPVVEVVLKAGVGFEDYEEIEVIGEPSYTWRSTGTPGDISTVGVVLNLGKKISSVKPGLKTVLDILPSYAR